MNKYTVKKPILQSQVVEWNGFKIEVTGQYEEGDPGVWTFSNGDPGYPPTSSNFYIEGISLIEGELLDFVTEIQDKTKHCTSFSIEEKLEELVIKKIES